MLEGIRHNIPFLASIMANARWRDGALSTRFIKEEYPDGFTPTPPEGALAVRFVAVALAIDRALDERRGAIAGAIRPHRPYGGDRAVLLGKARHDVEVAAGDDLAVRFEAGGEAVRVASRWLPRRDGLDRHGRRHADRDDRAADPQRAMRSRTAALPRTRGVFTRRQADLAALMLEREDADDLKTLLCPMPGLVKKIHVKEGQAVKAGDPLCLVEAMKMENVLRAERDVTVKTIEAAEGASLAVDAPIMTFV